MYVGDGNNVTASLAYAAALSGVELTVASPPGYELDDLTVERARNLGGTIELDRRPVRGGRAAPTRSTPTCGRRWARRRSRRIRRAAFAGYTVDDALMAAAGEQAWFLHCLPAHRGEEVAADR